MKKYLSFRRTIAVKIGIAFGVIMFCVIGSSLYTALTLNSNKKISEEMVKTYNPSAKVMSDLYNMISNSQMLIKSWVYIDKKEGTPDKIHLQEIHSKDFPEIKAKIKELSPKWDKTTKSEVDTILSKIDLLFQSQETNVMLTLNNFDAYQDMMIPMMAQSFVDDGGEIVVMTEDVLARIDVVKKSFDDLQKSKSEAMISSFNTFSDIIYIIGVVLLVIAFMAAATTVRSIKKPIDELKDFLILLSKGVFPENKVALTNDEIGDMASALNHYIDSLKLTAEFSKEIGEGNLEAHFEPLSEKDVLGNSLIEMQRSLQNAAEEEHKRKQEDDNRNWSTEGYAKFGEILRQNNDNMEVLTFDVIKNLVKYLNANQGGVFILNDSDKENIVLEMTACYAYDRRKFLEKQILVGEGLIGTCFIEAQTIFLTDVPDDYMNITSGLGHENPSCVVIVPLKLNDVVYGIIEIASFEILPQFKIEFLERVAESIASTISSVKVNIRTAQLLEISQQQSEEMRAQEEEMRQNMEEMHATQEEMGRKTAEMQGLITALNASVYIMEFDISGRITSVNSELSRALGIPVEQIKGRNHRDFNPFENQDQFWNQLQSGNILQRTSIFDVLGKKLFLAETYTPIFDNNGDAIKVLNIAVDISQTKLQEMDMQEQTKELQTQQEELRQNMEELTAIQEQLEAKDIQQQKEIERLNAENQAKLEEIARKEAESVKLMERSQAKEFEMGSKITKLTELIAKHGLNDELDFNGHTEFIPWTPEFSVGIHEIDNQHKILFNLINNLYDAFTQGSARDAMGKILNELVDYTVVHFGNEEVMFSDHKYPKVVEHLAEHHKLVAQVMEFKNAFDKGEMNVSYDLMNFLKSWLYDHIQKVDKQYTKHFNDLGIV